MMLITFSRTYQMISGLDVLHVYLNPYLQRPVARWLDEPVVPTPIRQFRDKFVLRQIVYYGQSVKYWTVIDFDDHQWIRGGSCRN